MPLEQVKKGLVISEVVFQARNRQSRLPPGQLYPRVTVDNGAFSRDDDWILKSQVTSALQHRQLRARSCELVPKIAGMRDQLVEGSSCQEAVLYWVCLVHR